MSWKLFIIGLFMIFAILSVIISLAFGAVSVDVRSILSVLLGNTDSDYYTIIWNIRLPRTLVAVFVGINLALSGALLQGVMRNPMADPHIIGVSSGAGLFGTTMLLVFPAFSHLLVPVAFVGALTSALLIYLLAWDKGVSPMRIILAGVAASAFLNSGVSALYTFYSDRIQGAVSFMVGSLSAKSWGHVETIIPYSIIGLILALLSAQRMNVLLLGDPESRSLGLNTEGYRLWFIAISALLAASAISIVGLLGFVGLIVPHAARILVGNDYRILLPASALLGVTVLCLSDTIGRVAFAPIELPVGIIMGVIGAPFFLYLLRKKRTI
ncbi:MULTISPECIES: iron ABC transporter permease [unclassified Paenibacillus]|nr:MULTISPECIES: iron ABC transporter permease [unclassified Paenibacillus]MBD8836875.1 iron ABC transporter permease [Paenibacillus sp. CFBP 13594]PRA08126.1 ferrichrome ABC transporter [Paenibacillus sp. MYb63]PRA51580.1 ferrichrome ABC transporter [Paenibacillus sp. MYb67]